MKLLSLTRLCHTVPARFGASRARGRRASRSLRDWAYLAYRLARRRRWGRAAHARALGALPHWNEDRPVPPEEPAVTLAQAAERTARVCKVEKG